LGVDGANVLGCGEKRPEMGSEQPVAVGYVNEHDLQAMLSWLEGFLQRLAEGPGTLACDWNRHR